MKSRRIAILLLALSSTAQGRGADRFLGYWESARSHPDGPGRLFVYEEGGGLQAKIWGRCTATDCSWQVVPLEARPSSTDAAVGGAETVEAAYDRNGESLRITLSSRNQGELGARVQAFSDAFPNAGIREAFSLLHYAGPTPDDRDSLAPLVSRRLRTGSVADTDLGKWLSHDGEGSEDSGP